MTASAFPGAQALGAFTLSGLFEDESAEARSVCAGVSTGGLAADCAVEAPALFPGIAHTPAAGDGRRSAMTMPQFTTGGGLRDVTSPFEMAGRLSAPVLRDLDGDEIPDGDIEAGAAVANTVVRAAGGIILEAACLFDDGKIVTAFQMLIGPAARRCALIDGLDASRDRLNEDVPIAECKARDWH